VSRTKARRSKTKRHFNGFEFVKIREIRGSNCLGNRVQGRVSREGRKDAKDKAEAFWGQFLPRNFLRPSAPF
jgi:hypothetical protein